MNADGDSKEDSLRELLSYNKRWQNCKINDSVPQSIQNNLQQLHRDEDIYMNLEE